MLPSMLAMIHKGLSPELVKVNGRSSLTRLDLNSILLPAEKEAQWYKKSCMSDLAWENICAWYIRKFVIFSVVSTQLCAILLKTLTLFGLDFTLCLLFISSVNMLLTRLRSFGSLFYAAALLSPLFKMVWYWQMFHRDSYLLQICLVAVLTLGLIFQPPCLDLSLDLVCLLLSMFLPQTESCFFTIWELRLVVNWRKGSLIPDGRDPTDFIATAVSGFGWFFLVFFLLIQ